jgi:hypothetical protein
MNLTETKKAMAVIQEIYPRFMDGRDAANTVAIWAKMFPGEEYPRVEAAILAFVASDVKGFPPSIGQIKDKLAQMQADNTLDEAGAWALVAAAMRNGIYGSKKEFAKLPYDVQRAVGSPNQLRDWALMDMEVVNSVVCSNFMRSYRARAVHTRELQKLPESVRQMYLAVGDAFAMERALPAPERTAPEPEPEPTPCPDSVRGVLDTMRQKAEADKVESAKRKVASMMQRFGIAGSDARS